MVYQEAKQKSPWPTESPQDALLEVIESIASHQDIRNLSRDLARRLHRVANFEYLSLLLHNPRTDMFKINVLEGVYKSYEVPEAEIPAESGPAGIVLKTQQPLTGTADQFFKRFPQMEKSVLRQHKVRSLCMLPLTTAQRRLGVMGIGTSQEHEYEAQEVEFLRQVARQVAVAVDNALNAEAVKAYQDELAHKNDRLEVLLGVTSALVSNLDLDGLLHAISECLRRVVDHDSASLTFYNAEKREITLCVLDFPTASEPILRGQCSPVEGSLPGRAILSRQTIIIRHKDIRGAGESPIAQRMVREGIQSGCIIPLIHRDRVLGTLNVGSRRANAFSQDQVEILNESAKQVAIAVENAIAFKQIAELKEKLAKEKIYLQDEIRTEHNFEDIIGESRPLRRVLKQVETVAPAESNVLILGETGTGKEMIARAIHNLSARQEQTFVKVNCATIPTGLLESELFGHERGAFTGAVAQKIGRVELADQGTLFLDEIGDIPLELQPKLLRVLQEREFERLGSTRTVRVSVRVVAATNRDLAAMIAAREFREDLYYRLNVFPIVLPPLRERREDIPTLVRYFAQRYSRRMNKQIDSIPSEAMESLLRYAWPGNIRELENFIERAVILTSGSVLHLPLGELKPGFGNGTASGLTLEAAEREHIVRVLRDTQWVLGGPRGAALRLGMKRTTLQSRMQKLGISRPV
ncbi:MAG TPA: sigma 54-interacting transcriptional regulator [Terriglobia bacterium]|nr:sigma 54-interacting transcriptional regulator [Terriglobia bacterium]